MQSAILIVLASFVATSFGCVGNGCGGDYSFDACSEPVCYSGRYIGYGCHDGVCDYVCYGLGCRNFGYGGYGVHPKSTQKPAQKGLYDGWAHGAQGQRGCKGGNCGYWGGCDAGRCVGYYNFRKCNTPVCTNGPFYGFGCDSGVCAFVCYGDACHATQNYGKDCENGECDYPEGSKSTANGDATHTKDSQ
ncbi:unnamed protein product [Mesocestoides corti]|uniref:EGF-like domain-containing protein n=1 Tax=Mesocestoides corti TaxID=53468 RepID=A0A0R3UJG3_MESCO|nr:unnamed protein product [Mesocestoides corti]